MNLVTSVGGVIVPPEIIQKRFRLMLSPVPTGKVYNALPDFSAAKGNTPSHPHVMVLAPPLWKIFCRRPEYVRCHLSLSKKYSV